MNSSHSVVYFTYVCLVVNQFCCQSIVSYISSPNRRKRLELTISNVVMNQGDSHFGGVTGDFDGNGGWSSSSSSSKVCISHKNNYRKRFCRWFIPPSKLDIESRQMHVFQMVVMDPVEDQMAGRILDGPIIMEPIISKHIDCQNRLEFLTVSPRTSPESPLPKAPEMWKCRYFPLLVLLSPFKFLLWFLLSYITGGKQLQWWRTRIWLDWWPSRTFPKGRQSAINKSRLRVSWLTVLLFNWCYHPRCSLQHVYWPNNDV